MLFPISDDDRHLMSPAWVSICLLVANVGVFFYQLVNPEFALGYSAIPMEITQGVDLVDPAIVQHDGEKFQVPQAPGPSPIYLTLLTSMFMHGGWGHLGGNMLYLWIFGDNVEHRFGALPFLAFYVISGIAASIAQIALAPDSVIPTLGASGAISGVLGAYVVLFPKNKVMAVFLYRIVSIPAIFVLGLWAVMQIIGGAGSYSSAGTTGGVAYAAHIGGFIAGVFTAGVVRLFLQKEPESVFRDIYRRY